MISVQNHRHAVQGGDLVHMLRSGDGSSNRGSVVGVVDRLSADELSASLGESDHDGSSVFGSGLHTCVDGVGSDDVDSGDGVSILLGVLEKIFESLTSHNPGLDRSRELGKSLLNNAPNEQSENKKCIT